MLRCVAAAATASTATDLAIVPAAETGWKFRTPETYARQPVFPLELFSIFLRNAAARVPESGQIRLFGKVGSLGSRRRRGIINEFAGATKTILFFYYLNTSNPRFCAENSKTNEAIFSGIMRTIMTSLQRPQEVETGNVSGTEGRARTELRNKIYPI